MSGAPIITAQGLEKAYGHRIVLGGVSVSVHEGERLGLVGINGSGKSTLARLLCGAETPDGGAVVCRRDATVIHLSQEPNLTAGATARQVVTEGLGEWTRASARHAEISDQMALPGANLDALVKAQDEAGQAVERLGGWDLMHRVDSVIEELGVSRPDGSVDEMSGGERRRVALAQVLVARPTLAILDEPTNHLDVETIEWLERYLIEEYPGALLLITHDRYVLDRVVTRTLELDRGALLSYDGGWEDYLTAKAERLALEARSEQNRQNYLRRELEWLRRQPKARTGKQKARIQRVETRRDDNPQARREKVARLEMQSTRTGKTVVEMKGLCVEIGGMRLVESFDLSLLKGERIGIVGPNGAGKTTLLRVLMGQLEPAGGELVVGKNTRFAYFDQARSGLDEEGTVLQNVAGDRLRVQLGDQEVDVRSWLQGFLFDGDTQRKKVKKLSGGERARVLLAKMLLQPANVLLLDEPTNDLDVATLGALEEMLVDLSGTALVVTHDRYFLDRIATSIISFEGEGRVVRYAGSYQAFREERAASKRKREARARDEQKATRAEGSPAPKKKSSLTYGERIELEGMMERIEVAEGVVSGLERALADPELYVSRGDEVTGLNGSLERARAEVETLLARWQDLETRSGG